MNIEEVIAEAVAFCRETEKNAFTKYLHEVGFTDTFAYDLDRTSRTVVIYTSRPGLWIGFRGKGVQLLKDILKDELKNDYEVMFKEIRGNFISVQ